jgi:mannose-1-phosphate guanylyltransferase
MVGNAHRVENTLPDMDRAPFRRVAVIMAGGAGERFWPVSTPGSPKQFLRLADPESSLLAQAADRAVRLVGTENSYVATGAALVGQSRAECPGLPDTNFFAEPARRNTAGCLALAAGSLIAADPDGWPATSMAVLTADHRIEPYEAFAATMERCFAAAEATGGLVTVGIRPDRPETGFGYIESGTEEDGWCRVARFTEKPDGPTAQRFLEHGGYYWNSGMFVWTLTGFMSELELASPETAHACREIAAALSRGDAAGAEQAFLSMSSISIDYALMERARRVYVVPAQFEWDDLGSWDALSRSLAPDADGNVSVGCARLVDSTGVVTYDATGKTEICVLGCSGLVVAVAEGKVLVVPKSRAQDVKRLAGG